MSALRILLAEPYSTFQPRLSLLGLKQAIENSTIDLQTVKIAFATEQLSFLASQTDVIVFSLSNPNEIGSVIDFLSCAKIKIERCNRNNEDPLIVAGGMGVANPESLSDFFDAFIIGQSYNPFLHFLHALAEIGRNEIASLYDRIIKIKGLYIPEFTNISYAEDGTITDFSNPFDFADNTSCANHKFMTKVFDDEAMLLPDMGCKHRCSFCSLAHWFDYNPIDLSDIQRGIDHLADQGIDKIKLNSASVSQHPRFLEILQYIRSKKMTVAIGSVRADEINDNLLRELSGILRLCPTHYLNRRFPRNHGLSLTFGLECGTNRLLKLINKNLTIEKIKESISCAVKNGITNIGEYFIVGIPTEREEELYDIANLILFTYNCVKPFNGEVFININPLIPKPNTPLQGAKILSASEYKEKVNKIKLYIIQEIGTQAFCNYINFDLFPLELLSIETLAFRGDQRIGKVLAKIHWENLISEEQINNELRAVGLPSLSFYQREIPYSEIVPWQAVISTFVKTEENAYLRRVAHYV